MMAWFYLSNSTGKFLCLKFKSSKDNCSYLKGEKDKWGGQW